MAGGVAGDLPPSCDDEGPGRALIGEHSYTQTAHITRPNTLHVKTTLMGQEEVS